MPVASNVCYGLPYRHYVEALTGVFPGAREDRDMDRLCLAQIAQIAQEAYGEPCSIELDWRLSVGPGVLKRVELAQTDDRGFLENIQRSLLHCVSLSADDRRKSNSPYPPLYADQSSRLRRP